MVRSLAYYLWGLCINIDADAGFQFNCDVVIPDGDLLDPASHQRFIKFSKVGGLLRDVILQVVNSLYLFVPCGGIDGCFLAEFSESEDFIRYFIVVFFAVGFLDQLLLRVISFSSMLSMAVACEARMTAAMLSWSCA